MRRAPDLSGDRPGVDQCRECGCTDAAACEFGCFWVASNLCSACLLSMRLPAAPSSALWVWSPWYGVLELVSERGAAARWGTLCWNGEYVANYVTETLLPLTPSARAFLGCEPLSRAELLYAAEQPIDCGGL